MCTKEKLKQRTGNFEGFFFCFPPGGFKEEGVKTFFPQSRVEKWWKALIASSFALLGLVLLRLLHWLTFQISYIIFYQAKGQKAKRPLDEKARKFLFGDDPVESEEEEIPPEEPEVPELELNGKSELPDVRQQLRKWIKHCSCPSKTDVLQIVEFLKRKLLNQNDEFVFLLLKTFYRLTQDADNINWIEAYQRVTCDIQEFFQSKNHGKKLFLKM